MSLCHDFSLLCERVPKGQSPRLLSAEPWRFRAVTLRYPDVETRCRKSARLALPLWAAQLPPPPGPAFPSLRRGLVLLPIGPRRRMAGRDPASACSAGAFRLRHLHLELSVGFGASGGAGGEVRGSVRLELTCLEDRAAELLLDSHPTVEVQSAAWAEAGGAPERLRPLPFQDHRPFASYGSALRLAFPEPLAAGDALVVEVAFRAGAGPGVCWLTPEQTAGKQKPYMYTQGQAVLNRSFFPCFDTPAVKSPYSAVIKVPDGFTAVMSAVTQEKRKDNTFFFKMPHPIPSYLIALVVGDIVSAKVGPRSHVWAEPCLIEAARKEYDGVIEEFLATGEKLFGPYVWERYDVLFMPPSFPFGGMENPCITFVTPCLLAGDRSLADVIIHEISHSWFGNLVTNAQWGEFWLNEGFTMYAQRRITTELYGAAYCCLEAATGRALLRQHMDNTGEDHPLNKLRVKIEPGVDPEDTYNETPYEKGYCFVSYLAHLVGDQSKFDGFLQAYVNQFKFQSITADDALEFYLNYFPELKKKGVDAIPGLEFDRWLNTPGWPPYLPDLSPGEELMKPAEKLADLWASSDPDMKAIKTVDISSWKTYQLIFFLDKILQKSPLPDGNVEKMSSFYPKISKAENAELRLRWCQILLKNNHEAEFSKVKDFLQSQGKQKYTLPIYRAMVNSSETARALAVEAFSATAPQLHVNVQNYVKKILGLNTKGN